VHAESSFSCQSLRVLSGVSHTRFRSDRQPLEDLDKQNHRTSNRPTPLLVVLAAPVFAGGVIVISSSNFVVSLAGEGPPPNHIPELYGRVLQSPALIIITTGIVMLWLLGASIRGT